MAPLISIIIVNYKTPLLTLNCVKSVIDNLTVDHEIIIIDNNSNDESKELILSTFPDVDWITNPLNEGFGRANNIGFSKASGKYFLMLNSDVTVPKGTIEYCLEKMREPQIGVLGCKLVNEDGSLQKSTYNYIGDHLELIKDNLFINKLLKFPSRPIRAVMGSFFLMPAKVVDEVGGFDPDFFMYCEELELCNRISKLGYIVSYIEEVYAVHKHGGSSTSNHWPIRQTHLSRTLLVWKLKGWSGLLISHSIFIINTVTNFLLMWLLDKQYRADFYVFQRNYYFNFFNYLTVPFRFTRKFGNGKRFLKSR